MNDDAAANQQNPSVPSVWIVVLGFNNAADTVDCLKSLAASDYPSISLVFVDNASSDNSVARVMEEIPSAHVLQTGKNLGFAKGYNVGMDFAWSQGADYVFMINNDTIVDPACVSELVKAAQANPAAGVIVPKIYYFDHPKCVWSAGSKFRRFPPSIVMRKTAGEDDGRFDRDLDLEFATTCALLLTRPFLAKTGLLDPDYFIMYDDYDWSVRARDDGFGIRLVPSAHLWHKVSKSTGVGTRSPFFWTHYGRSTALFFRKHANRQWMTGPAHLLYILARMIAEGKYFGLRPFLKGYREGQAIAMNRPPLPGQGGTDGFETVRAGHPLAG